MDKIEIVLMDGSRVEVEILAREGNLALHKTKSGYVLTHVPTGRYIPTERRVRSKAACIEMMKELAPHLVDVPDPDTIDFTEWFGVKMRVIREIIAKYW